MQAKFHVQQRGGRDWRWRTVITVGSHSAAEDLADELRRALDESPYSPATPVRVVSVSELAEETRVAREACKALRRAERFR